MLCFDCMSARRICLWRIGKPSRFDARTIRIAAPKMRLLTELPAIENETATTSGASGRRRFDPVRSRRSAGVSRPRGLRHAVSFAVEHLGCGARLGDTPPVALLFARPAAQRTHASATCLEVLK